MKSLTDAGKGGNPYADAVKTLENKSKIVAKVEDMKQSFMQVVNEEYE